MFLISNRSHDKWRFGFLLAEREGYIRRVTPRKVRVSGSTPRDTTKIVFDLAWQNSVVDGFPTQAGQDKMPEPIQTDFSYFAVMCFLTLLPTMRRVVKYEAAKISRSGGLCDEFTSLQFVPSGKNRRSKIPRWRVGLQIKKIPCWRVGR